MEKIQDLYSTRVRPMPPAERLQLARLILDDLAPTDQALDISDEANTASVMFEAGVVKALLRRQSKSRHILCSPSRASSPESTLSVVRNRGGNPLLLAARRGQAFDGIRGVA